jgi:hypothetical protein
MVYTKRIGMTLITNTYLYYKIEIIFQVLLSIFVQKSKILTETDPHPHGAWHTKTVYS